MGDQTEKNEIKAMKDEYKKARGMILSIAGDEDQIDENKDQEIVEDNVEELAPKPRKKRVDNRYTGGMNRTAIAAANRLTDEDKEEIYKLAGEGFSKREIIYKLNKKLKKEGIRFALHLRAASIDRIVETPEAQRRISFHRVEFLKTVKDIPIADKKVRLDDLENMRQRLRHIINNVHFDKGEDKIGRFLSVSKRLIEILDMARNEMEPKSGIAIGIGLGQGELGELTDEQLQQERNDIIRRARVAIQRGTSTVDEDPAGDETEGQPESNKVFLAAPEELQRNTMQPSSPDVSDIRQQKSNDPRLPTV